MELGITDLMLLISTWCVVAFVCMIRYRMKDIELRFRQIISEWIAIQKENDQLFNEFGSASQEKDRMVKEFSLVLERMALMNEELRKLKEKLDNPPASNE